jgi:hypothetical protein
VILKLTAVDWDRIPGGWFQKETVRVDDVMPTAVDWDRIPGGWFQKETVRVDDVMPVFVEWSPLVIVEEIDAEWFAWEAGVRAVVRIGKKKYWVKESPAEILTEVRAGKLGAVCPYCDTVSGEECPNCGAPNATRRKT